VLPRVGSLKLRELVLPSWLVALKVKGVGAS
jgi:hypothetical protein